MTILLTEKTLQIFLVDFSDLESHKYPMATFLLENISKFYKSLNVGNLTFEESYLRIWHCWTNPQRVGH